jgi:tagatose-1,6-bisphosphate aldolase non-catalytic subunit AgaZ/GatZ
MSEPWVVLAEDYRFTADLLRQHAEAGRPDQFRAVCSNNLLVILAALDAAANQAEKLEEETP